jgi:hypothetical protein
MAVQEWGSRRIGSASEGGLMAAVLPFGEKIEIFAELGFLVREFTLNSSTLDGTDVLDGTLEGLDIAPYVQQARISRGRSSQLDPFSAGTLSLVLNNNDRRFDPLNQASPYYDPAAGRSGVVPRRKVSILCDDEPVFVGQIVDVDVDYELSPASRDLSTAVLTCADDFQILANDSTEAAVTPSQELSGSRVSYLLDLPEISYLGARSIQPGVAILGAYPIAENTSAVSYLQSIAEAEQGLCFISRDGTLTFVDRQQAQFSSASVSFSDDGTGIPYQTLSIRYGSEILFNRVIVTPEGLSPQTSDDVPSQTEFGVQTLSLTDSLLASEPQAAALADDLISLYAEPEYRFDSLTVIMNGKDEPTRQSLFQLELGTQIEITRTFATGSPLSVSDTYQIQKISHSISPATHLMEIGLGWIPIVFPLILDDAEFGKLSSDNALV